jgi:hypothetical protein
MLSAKTNYTYILFKGNLFLTTACALHIWLAMCFVDQTADRSFDISTVYTDTAILQLHIQVNGCVWLFGHTLSRYEQLHCHISDNLIRCVISQLNIYTRFNSWYNRCVIL